MTNIELRTLEIICSTIPKISEQLKRIADSMENEQNEKVCCICGETFTGYGNNPYPIANNGKCCDKCNEKVILARIVNLRKKGE